MTLPGTASFQHRMKSVLATLLAIAGTLLFAGCHANDSVKIAASSAEAFHDRYDSRQFTDIYRTATPEFKLTAPEAGFLAFIQSVYRRLGSFTSGARINWRINVGTGGTVVVLTYDSRFERGNAQETFTLLVSGETALLQAYNITSPVLLSEKPPSAATPIFASPAEAQREAVRRYPDLAVAGSLLNVDFVARHARYLRDYPNSLRDSAWPLRLAEESARAVKAK